MTFNDEQRARFWALVAITSNDDDCWLWMGTKTNGRYGTFKVGEKATSRTASRLALIDSTSSDPSHLEASHICKNRHCVNPRHLLWETHRENLARSQCYRKLSEMYRGSGNPAARLDEVAVYRIRNSGESVKKLAARYGVCAGTIRSVLRRDTWSHVH